MKDKKSSPSIEIYLPDYSFNILNSKFDINNKFSNNKNISFSLSENKRSLNGILCESIGYDANDLPWNQLRALQFNLDKINLGSDVHNVEQQHTLACCDPVMMQVTHRGAYLWGQDSLNFSTEDVIAIVAQINDKLMEKGEFFYLLNNKQWLYVNEKSIELNQRSFESEIGRDQFGFSYQGKDKNFWNRLATEIQMLIKQMIDYQGLTSVSEDSLINVHFWGDSNRQLHSSIKVDSSARLILRCNNELIRAFANKANIEYGKLLSINEILEMGDKSNIIISFFNDRDWLENMLQEVSLINFSKKQRLKEIRIILQDKTIEITPKHSFFHRLFSRGF